MQLHPTSTQPSQNSEDTVARTLQSAARYLLIIAFGLVPILFLPVSYVPLGYSKTLLVAAGVLFALVLFSLSVLRSGKVQLSAPLALWGIWAVAGISLLSAALSGDIRDAMLGEAWSVHSALFIVLLALIVTVAGIFNQAKAHIMRLYMLLAGSTVVLGLYHLMRLFFGETFLSLGIFTSEVASPIGGWNDLALFFGLSVILSIVALEQLPLPKLGRALFSGVIAIALIMLAIINFFAVWVVLGVLSLIMLMYALTKDRFDLKATPMGMANDSGSSLNSIVVSAAVFVVSAVFIVGGSFIGTRISDSVGINYVEVRPSVTATFDIARNVYAENAFLGIGPNRFADAWRLYKNRAINDTIFWNSDFDAGNGYISSLFVTTGVFGALAWIIFLGLFAYTGVKMLFRSTVKDKFWYFIGTSSFAAALYLWGMSIIYVPGSAILILAAVCTGMTLVAQSALLTSSAKSVTLTTDRRAGFFLIALVMLVIIGSVSGMYNIGRHYVGLYTFNQALASIQEGVPLQQIERKISNAFELSSSDTFANQIALYQLGRMNTLLSVTSPSEAQQQQFQNAVANGINAARLAVEEDETNPRNWATLGSVYSILASSNVPEAEGLAREAFVTARTYGPLNPEYALLEAQLESRLGNLDAARTKANEAVRLKPNYTNALLFLAQLDIAEGDVQGAIARTISLVTLEPQNAARHYQLGVLYTSDQQLNRAIQSFEQAIAIDPEYANARYLLALAYVEQDRVSDAIAQLEVVRDLNPDNRQVETVIEELRSGDTSNLPTASEVAEPVPDSVRSDVTSPDRVPDTDLLTPVNVPATTNSDAGTPQEVGDLEVAPASEESVNEEETTPVTEPGA